jgi:ABC-2 type transport system permease protein
MKVIDIALKDMLRSFRSVAALAFMFVLPLLTSGIFYFAFGGLTGDDGGFDLPVTRVQVVNQDQPAAQLGGLAAGQVLLEFLQDEQLAGLLRVTTADDPGSARAAVDAQKAGVAVIIPPDFTTAAFTPGGSTTIVLYQDPTLTIGPSIVKGIVSQFVDGFAGAVIATDVATEQLGQRGLAVDEATLQEVAASYSAWAQGLGESQGRGEAILSVQAPPDKAESDDPLAGMIAGVMAAMMIFFAFFTGANTAQTILQEDEAGTLARLFTTPTPRSAILGGKFVATFITLIVQVIVLVVVSVPIFDVHWGEPPAVALAILGLVVIATGFGVMLISFLKSTRQAGPVMGAVLTVSGMAGGLFTSGMPDAPAAFDTLSLFTPHGWAFRGWELALDGGSAGDVLPPVVVSLGIGVACFVVGAFFFRRRFA